MRRYMWTLLLPVLFCSCNKDNNAGTATPPLVFSEQKYAVEISGRWTTPDFKVPANAHFTNFIGLVHSKDSLMWKPGLYATTGLENLAENGSNGVMLRNLDTIIAHGKGLSRFLFLPTPVNGSKTDTLLVNTNYSRISFASMIAPSPDWFTGINGYDLIQNNAWVNDITVPLYCYDAGTEEGDVFAYNNPATTPQQPVAYLQAVNATVLANGNAVLKPIAFVRFRRLSMP